jgi:hypothetical protein
MWALLRNTIISSSELLRTIGLFELERHTCMRQVYCESAHTAAHASAAPPVPATHSCPAAQAAVQAAEDVPKNTPNIRREARIKAWPMLLQWAMLQVVVGLSSVGLV